MIDIWGLVLWRRKGIFINAFPNFPCDRMIYTTDLNFKNAVFRLEGDRKVKVVFAGGLSELVVQC
jgi:hypothetical protein